MTWAVFGQTVGHQFINYDDPLYVTENTHIKTGLSWRNVAWAFTHVHSQNWHPLTSISHMLDCQLFGLQPWWPHLVNVMLHTATAVLLFLILAQMTGKIWPSGFAAALFTIHPLRVESVAWIAERKDVLSGFFFILTLLAYFQWTKKQTMGRYVATVALFACGLMSKPMLVTLPLILLLIDYWPLNRREKWTSLVMEKVPLLALSIGSCLATLWAQNFALGSTESLPLQWRITNAIVSYFDYVRQMFWPVGLIPFYIHPENRLGTLRLSIAAIFLIAITVMVIVRRRQNPYLFVGWFWYVVMLVPVIGIIQVGLQGRADRYTYLPQIGLYLTVTWLVRDLTRPWHGQRIYLGSVAMVVIGTLSILSWKQTGHWRDTETLWKYTLSVTPESDVAHTGLGGILFTQGKLDEAIEHYQRALQVRDGNVAAHYGLAKALASKQRTDEAIVHFQKALSIQPDYIAASNDLGVMFASKGEISNAINAWRQTLSFDPDNADAENNIAWVLATSADADLRDGNQAVALAQRAIRSGGENPYALRTLAAAQAETGQFAAAVATAERGRVLAAEQGNDPMADSLRRCSDLFRRGEALHTTQVSH